MTEAPSLEWRMVLARSALIFAIACAGCAAAFALWLHDLAAPQVAFLGSGNRLSLLVMEGPARLLLATGDDPIAYENALASVQPLFARRVDLLLIAGDGQTLLAPMVANRDPHLRIAAAIAPLPPSPEAHALGSITPLRTPTRIRLGPTVSVVVETALPFGADPASTFPAWRATIERGETRIVVLSDGEAAALFPPAPPASVLAVSGDDPIAAWEATPAVAMVMHADAMSGPEMRESLSAAARPPQWAFRVAPSEALRLHFVTGGVALPSASAQAHRLGAATPAAALRPQRTALVARVNRRGRLWRAGTRP